MHSRTSNKYTTLSWLSLTLTITISAVHHLYRDGLGLIVPWLVLIALPYGLLHWFGHTKQRWLIWLYGLYNVLVITQLGIVDGFLDHTLKALGFQHLTLLPGGDAAVVKTVFALWSPQAGNIFYEGTGVLTFIGSVFATVYLYRFIQTLGPRNQPSSKDQLIVSGEIKG
jgi:hypothetical protein